MDGNLWIVKCWVYTLFCLWVTGCVQHLDSGNCPPGSEGCECYGSQSCDYGYECVDDVCMLKQGDGEYEEEEEYCTTGTEGCACFDNGTCYEGLACANGVLCMVSSGGDEDTSESSNSCQTDLDCVALYGSSYVCNTTLGTCEEDDPLADYRCTLDAECRINFGSGWSCSETLGICQQMETDGDEENEESEEIEEWEIDSEGESEIQ